MIQKNNGGLIKINFKLPHPIHQIQAEMLKFCEHNNPAKEMYVAVGTKAGKTFGASLCAVHSMLTGEQKVIRWFAPIYLQSKIGMRYIERFLPVNSQDKRLRGLFEATNSGTPTIRNNINNNMIQFLHANNPESMEGEGSSINFCDEFAKYKNGMDFYASVKTTTTFTQGKILAFSTPRGKNNHFYKLFMHAKEEMDYALKHNKTPTSLAFTAPSSINILITQETLEEMKSKLPERLYRQYVLAEFIDDGSGFHCVNECVDIGITPQEDDDFFRWIHIEKALLFSVVIGVDWGKENDYTVFTAISNHESKAIVVGICRFRHLKYTEAVQHLKYFVSLFDNVTNIFHDKTGVGNALDDMLCEKNIIAEGIVFNNTNKNNMVEDLIVAFEQNRICIPNYSELINELSGYAVDILTSGKYVYNAEAGHDDLVCSLFLAYHCYKNATKVYEISAINLF